jgi:hypothetical protein
MRIAAMASNPKSKKRKKYSARSFDLLWNAKREEHSLKNHAENHSNFCGELSIESSPLRIRAEAIKTTVNGKKGLKGKKRKNCVG